MKVLVTGGAGFIGSHSTDALIARGDSVVILDNLQKPVHLKGMPEYLNPAAEFILGDVRDRETFRRALQGVDAVLHLAAYQDYLPDFSTFFAVNTVGTAMLYEIIVADRLPIKKVVVATSQAVNGEGLYHCVEHGIQHPGARNVQQLEHSDWEHHCPICHRSMQWNWTPESYSHPQNQYALSKKAQEDLTMAFGKQYDIPSVALRYSIVQGPRQSFYNAYSGACRIFSLHYFFGKAPTIYEDGLMMRDFVNYQDVVRANLLALDDPRMAGETYCVGGGLPQSILDFCNLVGRISGAQNIEPQIPGAYRFGDTRNSCSDISKLKALGWSPEHTVEESVTAYLDWLRSQTKIDEILEYAEQNMRAMNVVRLAQKP